MTKETKRVVLLVCAAGLVVGAVVRAWFTGHGVSIGLWGVELCTPGCHGVRWDNVPGAQDDLYLAGYAGVAASLVGAVLLALVASGKAALAKTARTVLGIAAVAMLYFVVRAFADGLRGVSVSFAAPIGLAAAIGGWFVLRARD